MAERTPRAGDHDRRQPRGRRMWTARIRRRVVEALPPDRLLPDRQPAYVASWIYVFGVVTIAALIVVIVTGCILALKGPQWWHVSNVGLYVNSCHLWSVELFFFAMVVHLWGKFFMAAWRGKRALTWVLGIITFLGEHRDGLHRVPLPDQLRLAVDLDPGEGRHQRHRRRRVLQRLELRPDAHVAHHAHADRGRRAHRRGTCSWCAAAGSSRRSPPRGRRRHRCTQRGPGTRGGRSMSRPRFKVDRDVARLHRALPPLRHRQGGHPRPHRHRPAHGGARGALRLARRARPHDQELGDGAVADQDFVYTAATELERHVGRRGVRPALQQRRRQRPEARAVWRCPTSSACASRSTPPRTSSSTRCAASPARGLSPRRSRRTRPRPRPSSSGLGERLRRQRGNGERRRVAHLPREVRERHASSCPRATTGPSRR